MHRLVVVSFSHQQMATLFRFDKLTDIAQLNLNFVVHIFIPVPFFIFMFGIILMTHFLPTNIETAAHTSATGISILNIGQCELHWHDNCVTSSLSEVVRQIVLLYREDSSRGGRA